MMATRPRQTEYDAIADAKHVVAMTRSHFAAIAAADAQRKGKLLPESRLAAFEASIAAFEQAVATRGATFTAQVGIGFAKGRQRAELLTTLVEIRDEVKLGRPDDAAMGRAFGVGMRLDRRSTIRLLVVGQLVLSSWGNPAFAQAAVDLGITAERIARLRALVDGLIDAQVEHSSMRGVGRGQTLDKKQELRKMRRETTYLRSVARLVFRQQPEVLVEFSSPVRRGTVRPRGPRSGKKNR
jgi:hypothetical protein